MGKKSKKAIARIAKKVKKVAKKFNRAAKFAKKVTTAVTTSSSSSTTTVTSSSQITTTNAVTVVTTQIVEVVQIVEYVTVVVEKTVVEQEDRLARIDITIKSTSSQLTVAHKKKNTKLVAKLVKKLKASKRNKKDANSKLKVAQAQRKVAKVGLAKAKHAKRSVD